MMQNQAVYLMFGVVIVAIVAEQMPKVGGLLLLVVVMGALVLGQERNAF
jgi:hypothetical protein